MGNGNIKRTVIKPNELSEFTKKTQFNQEVILHLNVYFLKFSSLLRDNGVINYDKFLTILNMNDNIFSQHLFYAFDRNNNGDINFREFIQFFGDFKNGDSLTKTKLAFKLFCNPQTNKIESQTMCNLLKGGLSTNPVLKNYISDSDLQYIVQQTFLNYLKTYNDRTISTNTKSGSHFDLNKSKIESNKQEESHCIFLYCNKNNATEDIIPNYRLPTIPKGGNKNLLSQKNTNNFQHHNFEISYEMFSEIIQQNKHILSYLDFNLDKLKHYYKENKCAACL